MSNKFTGITSGGQEIPVYDKAALHDAYSAGNNISINGNVISVTGRKSLAVQSPLSAEVSGNSIIISLDESAIDVSSKLDTSAFAEVSGSFLTSGDLDGYATEQWVGEQGYLTEVPAGYATTEDVISATSGLQPSGDYASATDLANYQPVSAMTGYQAAGDYLSGNALDSLSGTWETVTAKADTTALEAYQTIEGMSAYQPSGDYQPAGSYLSANALDSVSGDWNEVSAKLDTTAFSDVSGSFLTSVPDTYLQNTDLTIVDNKITEISGVPLSAGDELPASVSAATDYVTATSGDINDTINNVSANSGTWGGSALPISAGPGIKVDLVDNTLVFSNDETVLWSGGDLTIGATATLSETVKNFELFGVYGHESNRGRGVYQEFNPAVIENANTQNFALFLPDCAPDFSWAGWYIENLYFTDTAATALANVSGRQTWRWYSNGTWEDDSSNRHILVDKIVGINRISANV